jgi:plasmid stabilization system protein ParE
MKYEVVLTDGAARQLDEACGWYVQNASHVANDWYNGFLDALNSLEENPERFSLARENDVFPVEIRQLLYGAGKLASFGALLKPATAESVRRDLSRVPVKAMRTWVKTNLKTTLASKRNAAYTESTKAA